MLEEQRVPKASASLRWNFQNSPTPRVLLSVRINTIFKKKMVFPWKEMGIQWVPIGYQRVEKPSQCISENGLPMHADILFSIMRCTILCSVRGSPLVLSMSLWIIKLNVLSCFFFFWQPHRLNCDWNCIYVGNTSSKPPGPISTIDQSEILRRSQVQFITLFFGGATLCLHEYAVPT